MQTIGSKTMISTHFLRGIPNFLFSLFHLLPNVAKSSYGGSLNQLLHEFQIQNPSTVLENGSNLKPKVLQSLGQNSTIIYSMGPRSQIVLLHNSISFIGKGQNSPQETPPQILTHFSFQFFWSALGTLHDISTTMRGKEKSGKHAFGCNNNVCVPFDKEPGPGFLCRIL